MNLIPIILNDPLSRPALREALPTAYSPEGEEALPALAPSPLIPITIGREGGISDSNNKFYPSLQIVPKN
jgi:hypothetical protein